MKFTRLLVFVTVLSRGAVWACGSLTKAPMFVRAVKGGLPVTLMQREAVMMMKLVFVVAAGLSLAARRRRRQR